MSDIVSIQLEYNSTVEKALAQLEQTLTFGMVKFLGEEVALYIKQRAARRFQNEGDDVSGKWAPLLPVTQYIRSTSEGLDVGPDHPINKRTGELEAWVTKSSFVVSEASGGAVLQYPSKKPQGELEEKVITAQQGKSYPDTVARPVLGVNQTDMLFVLTQLAFFIQKDSGGRLI